MPLPNAAQQLIQQVQEYEGEVEYEVTDEPDGFGRNREITFDPKTSQWLAPVLKAIDDPRIANMVQHTKAKKKRLVVTFVGDARADQRAPFPLDEVIDVMDEDDSVGPGEQSAGDGKSSKE